MIACEKVVTVSLLRSCHSLHVGCTAGRFGQTLTAHWYPAFKIQCSPLSMLAPSLAEPEPSLTQYASQPSPAARDGALAMDNRPKIVVVIGPTGSGKSQFAVDVAKLHGNAEIVNCDVIQMYSGLDVASAKASTDERGGIPHHLMSFLHPLEAFTVRDFKHMADGAIKDITDRGKLPIIVGGTMYYVQSLIRDSLLEEDEAALAESKPSASCTSAATSTDTTVAAATETPYDRLSRVDPVMARRLHPNDHRKTQRALEVFDATGTPYSDVLLLQARRHVAASNAQYNAVVFWLQVRDQSVHNSRLDGRVGKMLRTGLMAEIKALAQYLRGRAGTDTTLSLSTDEPSTLTQSLRERCRLLSEERPKDESDEGSYQGLLQAIGYKEFEEYIDMINDGKLSEDEQHTVENMVISQFFDSAKPAITSDQTPAVASAVKALAQSVQRLLDVTHRYAKVQDRFIRNRFEKRNVGMHIFNTSDIETWTTEIVPSAFSIVSAWLKGEVAGCDATEAAICKDKESVETKSVDAQSIFSWQKYTCPMCDRTLNGEREWQDHLRSKGHKAANRYAETRERLREERGVILPLKRKRSSSTTPASNDGPSADGST